MSPVIKGLSINIMLSVSMPQFAVFSLTLFLGFLHIVADKKQHFPSIYLLKPLTVLCIIGSVFLFGSFNEVYHYAIVAGLVFSLIGDVFLMLKQRRFILGLVSFLIAHLIYIFAFFTQLIFAPNDQILFAFLAVGLLMYVWLSARLGEYAIPVGLYIAIISLMSTMALNFYLQLPTSLSLAALIGALLFQFSDSVLAVNKFRYAFASAQPMILSSYYVAQCFIAYSAFY